MIDVLFALLLKPVFAIAGRSSREHAMIRDVTELHLSSAEALVAMLRFYDPLRIAGMPGADVMYRELADRAVASVAPDTWSDPRRAARELEACARGMSGDVRVTVSHWRMLRVTNKVSSLRRSNKRIEQNAER